MKCPSCSTENKDAAKACKKCGSDMQLPPPWQPTWRWHLRTLGFIYAGSTVLIAILYFYMKPYIRTLPPEITPWLHPKR